MYMVFLHCLLKGDNIKDWSFYLDTRLSSFQYVFINGATLLSMYKYILFKSFGEFFILNTMSVVKEKSDGTFFQHSHFV